MRAVLEINGEVVDPSVPQYWWPREQAQVPEQVPDWSGWREIGATDDVPDAFRRRQPAVIDLNPGRFAIAERDAARATYGQGRRGLAST